MFDSDKAKGGHARARALTADERHQIAKKAAETRWAGDIPQTTHDGPLRIGNKEFFAAVLLDGTRLLSQGTFLTAIGRSRTPKAGTGGSLQLDGLPFFLQAEQLKPFIPHDLIRSTAPIFFRLKSGQKTVGYQANLLPQVCEVYLRFRDHCLSTTGQVPRQYRHIVTACDSLIRGLAAVGIIALVDEATRYQEVRDRMALRAILDRFLRKEFAAWAKRFLDEFYKQIFRLRGWEWRGMKVNRPRVVAKYTNDLVYERLAPDILRELEQHNPRDNKGNRRVRHHQWLTEEIGHPALAQHLFSVMAFMRSSDNWDELKKRLDVALPKQGSNMKFSFMAD